MANQKEKAKKPSDEVETQPETPPEDISAAEDANKEV